MSSGAWMMALVILIAVATLGFLISCTVRSIRDERSAHRSVWREFGLSIALMVLFFVTWAAQFIAQWQRFTDEQLTDILTYGRPFSPMPAWGIDGGGPMNPQQIDNLIAYLHSIEIPKDQARKEATDAAEKERQRLLGLGDSLAAAQAKVAAATTDADREAAEKEVALIETELSYNAGRYPSMGQALFNLNCARCHTLGWSYDEPRAPGTGAYGPPLTNVDNQFPDVDDQIDFVTNGRKRGEKYGLNGQSAGRMPHFGKLLSADQIEAIVKYERSLRETRS